MRVKVIVPVSTDIWNNMVREAYEAYKDRDTEIDVVNIEKGPESIEHAYDESWASLPTLLEAEKAEREGYDAVIDYCFNDPALTSIKEALNIPVVGLNEASIHLASLLGRKFSIIGVGGKETDGPVYDKIEVYGLSRKLASIRVSDIKVLDIKKKFNGLVNALLKEGRRAIEKDGADVLVLGCGGLFNIAEIMREKLNVPVIDSGLATLKIAEDLVKLKLAQSKKAYSKPYKKRRVP